MTDTERILAAREAQIDQMLPLAVAPASQGDILALEKTIILVGQQIAEAIMKARY